MVVESRKRHQMRHLDVLYRLLRDQEVYGSNPFAPTILRWVSGRSPVKFSNFMLLSLKRQQRVLVAKVVTDWGSFCLPKVP